MSAGTENYANVPLPETVTYPGWRVALVLSSFLVALPGFLYGAQAGLALGFAGAVLSSFVGGLLLCAGGCLTGIVSVRTRMTTYLLVQRSFGLKGAGLVNIVIAVVHYCWFGVNVSFLGDAMMAAAREGYGIEGEFPTFVVIGSVLITLSTIWGFRTLDRLASVAVPLILIVLAGVCWVSLDTIGFVTAPAADPPEPMSFGIAVSALIGNNMLVVAAMPDLSRYIRSVRESVAAMVITFPTAIPLLTAISAAIALATGNTDIMDLIVTMGFGAVGLLLLILSIWTINALNLYSAGLSMSATFPRVPQWSYVVVGGLVGMMFALVGIIDAFIPFLLALGLIVPPIAAIYVIDGFWLFRHADNAGSLENLPAIRWTAVLVWIASVAISWLAGLAGLTLTTIPALDATVVAAVLYVACLKAPVLRSAAPSATD